jgi:transposase
MKTHPVHQVRQRAHAILLSARRYRINQLADIFDVDRETITRLRRSRIWLNRWDQDGLDGLKNKPRAGRPRIISDERPVLKAVAAQPRQLKTVLAHLQDQFSVGLDTIKRLLKRHGYTWRRMRRSLKTQRDEAAFRAAQAKLKVLQKQENEGKADVLSAIDLVYFDEAGFSLQPVVPYAWQAPGEQVEVPSQSHHRRMNVLGFLKRDNSFDAFMSAVPGAAEGSVCSETVMGCIDAYVAGLRKRTHLVIDRARIHTSKAFRAAMARWQRKGLYLFYLPS